MRLTKIFMAIFNPDERLPSSATLDKYQTHHQKFLLISIYQTWRPHETWHSRHALRWFGECVRSATDLIFVRNITNYIRGEKLRRNFSFPCMTIVGKLKISPHVEKFQYNWWGFIAIYAVLLLNLLFTLFCCKIYFATIYALSCGEKLSPKVHMWRNIATGETSPVISSLTIMTFITRLLSSLDKFHHRIIFITR